MYIGSSWLKLTKALTVLLSGYHYVNVFVLEYNLENVRAKNSLVNVRTEKYKHV